MADIIDFKPKPPKDERICLSDGDYIRQCDECQSVDFHIGEDMGIYCANCLELCYKMFFDVELEESLDRLEEDEEQE